jgi:hypothetical protein
MIDRDKQAFISQHVACYLANCATADILARLAFTPKMLANSLPVGQAIQEAEAAWAAYQGELDRRATRDAMLGGVEAMKGGRA